MIPTELDARWQAAYAIYGQASEAVATVELGNPDAARLMASASREVSGLWWEIAGTPDLPWWALAAVRSAAQAFEAQAKDWGARADAWSAPRPGGRAVSSRRRDGGAR